MASLNHFLNEHKIYLSNVFMGTVALLCNLVYRYSCRLKEIKSLIVDQVTTYII
jgi:hypothetical protein